MCLVAFAWNVHPRWRLVLAGNRDEFHARPSAPLARWEGDASILAGRDLQAGGTWLGLGAGGRAGRGGGVRDGLLLFTMGRTLLVRLSDDLWNGRLPDTRTCLPREHEFPLTDSERIAP
jgi:hypothetical protein